jgi:ribonuclease-3
MARVADESPEDQLTEHEARVAECEQRLGHRFQNPQLLLAALTHSSGAAHRLGSNERLEFLGDAILGAIVCEHLFRTFASYQEGDLTKVKSFVVSRDTCARLAEQLGLSDFLILGKGLTGNQKRLPTSLLSDAFESIVGAVFLDGGYDAARPFILRHLGPEIEQAAASSHTGNYKSQLQQLAQREFGTMPVYIVLDEQGPDHRKIFKIIAQVGASQFAPAWGRNKKEAEQRAAMNALDELENGNPKAEAHSSKGEDIAL